MPRDKRVTGTPLRGAPLGTFRQRAMRRHLWGYLLLVVGAGSGCALVPEIAHEPQIQNPFPQLSRVAVLPFYNQSDEPTLNQDRVASAYYNELQKIPGFEVMPLGVVKNYLQATGVDPHSAAEFQQVARDLGVDAVIVGAVTDYTPYDPPRMTLAVSWYTANPCFHPIPPGYGLPWGRAEEEYIPECVVFESEFSLAREQLRTQTPVLPRREPLSPPAIATSAAEPAELSSPLMASPDGIVTNENAIPIDVDLPGATGLTDPTVAALPAPHPPPCEPIHDPVITHVRTFNGHDSDFTTALANYYHFRDDARFGGWQAYLQRSEDFIRFSCYLHLSQALSVRGGAGETRVVWRWPIDRYDH